MIFGVGTDIVEVSRIERAINRTQNFVKKAFTEKEQDYFKLRGNKSETIAGYFAAKEAVSKALGTGFRKFGLRDIEIINDNLGKPKVILSEKIIQIFELKDFKIHISISHTSNNAVAFVVLEAN